MAKDKSLFYETNNEQSFQGREQYKLKKKLVFKEQSTSKSINWEYFA